MQDQESPAAQSYWTWPRASGFICRREKNQSFSSLAGSAEFISLETEVHMVSAKLSLSKISFKTDITAEYMKKQV